MITIEDRDKNPNPLSQFYTRFKVGKRLLLTGHSHQAWPDCAFEGYCRAWEDAAHLLDEKWKTAFGEANKVRRGFARLLDDHDGHIALGANTHDLIVRFLSALPLKKRPRILTTDGEFHTIRRQLSRLSEEGVDVKRISAHPVDSLTERLAEAVDESFSAVMLSSVLFESGMIVPGLSVIHDACAKIGVEVLIDVYHHLNVVPFSIAEKGVPRAFIVGGGYKYCQLGEGNCFLRFPADCEMRPVVTGWFSEFSLLGSVSQEALTAYGHGPDRFAGSTYDPASHYRGAAVFEFFEEKRLGPDLLRSISQSHIQLLIKTFDDIDADPKLIRRNRSVSPDMIGGFLALESPQAGRIEKMLSERGIRADHRGQTLRLGPAPYISNYQIKDAMDGLAEVVGVMSSSNLSA